MKNNIVDLIRHKAVQNYISALDNGNLDEIQLVIEQAVDDPILDQMLVEINQAVEQEEGLTVFAKDATLVSQLVNKHFDSNDGADEFNEQLLTVGEVAARMQADRNIPPSDQSAHKILLNLSTQLPEFLNIQAVRKLAVQLQVNASDKFWRVFRDTAIMMGIGRGQAQMSAARKQNTNKSIGKETNHGKKSGSN
jgi:hypothetical protein